MNRYRVRVTLDEEYDDIVAEDEEDAFIKASDFAMSGGSWDKEIELLESNVEDEDV